jgi:hypothetical protein
MYVCYNSWRSRGSCSPLEVKSLKELYSEKENRWMPSHMIKRVKFASFKNELIYDAELREVFENFEMKFDREYNIHNQRNADALAMMNQSTVNEDLSHVKTYDKIDDYLIFAPLVVHLMEYSQPMDLINYSLTSSYVKQGLRDQGIWKLCWESAFPNGINCGYLPWSNCEVYGDHLNNNDDNDDDRGGGGGGGGGDANSKHKNRMYDITLLNANHDLSMNVRYEECFRKSMFAAHRLMRWGKSIENDIDKLTMIRTAGSGGGGGPLSTSPTPKQMFNVNNKSNDYVKLISMNVSDKSATSVNAKGDCTFHALYKSKVYNNNNNNNHSPNVHNGNVSAMMDNNNNSNNSYQSPVKFATRKGSGGSGGKVSHKAGEIFTPKKDRVNMVEMPRFQLRRKVSCACSTSRYLVIGLADAGALYLSTHTYTSSLHTCTRTNIAMSVYS